MKRSRGRGRRQQNPVNRSYDSNGPDVRVRGNASQVYEKYQTLARDAMSSGDRVMAENYQQHAEHYYRIMLSLQPPPSEADKPTATPNEAAKDGNVVNGDAPQSDTSDNNEPLVLNVANESAESEKENEKSAKPSRRRGPLRQKREDNESNGVDAEASSSSEDSAPSAE